MGPQASRVSIYALLTAKSSKSFQQERDVVQPVLHIVDFGDKVENDSRKTCGQEHVCSLTGEMMGLSERGEG